MKGNKISSRLSLPDKNELHRSICVFCGSIIDWNPQFLKSFKTICVCEDTKKFYELRETHAEFEVIKKFVEDHTKWYVYRTGKHGEVITSNKKEYDALMVLKQIRAEENKKKEEERAREWQAEVERSRIQNEIDNRKWKVVEAKRLSSSKQILGDATLKELVDCLIQITDKTLGAGYDELVDTNYKNDVTYDELKDYIQNKFEELVDREIDYRHHEEMMDE
jgi:hypothetical protein